MVINDEEIRGMVMNYVKNEFLDYEDDMINYDTPLISGGYVDSFSMISLLVYLENQFKIKIPAAKATPQAFNTINSITALVKQYIN
jgi:acyl carrier protein